MSARTGTTVAGVGLAVTGLLWWGTQEQVHDSDPHNPATALVPADGYRTAGQNQNGDLVVDENTRVTGILGLSTVPASVASGIVQVNGDGFEDWRLWRTTETPYDVAGDDPDPDDAEQATTIQRLTDQGIEELAVYGATSLVFDPPVLEVPADLHDGSSWGGHGTATTDGSILYSYEDTAVATGHGCYRLTGSATFTVGTRKVPQDLDTTWCPGRGPAPASPATLTRFAGGTTPLVPVASGPDAEEWSPRPRPLYVADSLARAATTRGPAGVTSDVAPVVLDDGTVVVHDSRMDDVWGFRDVDGSLVRAWVGHPGGSVTAMGAAGDVTVVATSARTAVGYGEHGQWLWSVPLPDVAVVAPVAGDADHILLTTLGGDVLAVDPRTGHVDWRATMSDQVRTTPVVSGDRAAVVDTAGRLTLFDLATGAVAWTTDLPSGPTGLGVSGSHVVTLADGVVQARALTDGRREWSQPFSGSGLGDAVVGLGKTVAVAAGSETVGLDAATGDTQWQEEGASSSIRVGSVLVQVHEQDSTARDAAGRLLGRWTLDDLRGATSFLVQTADGALVEDAVGDVVEVGP